MKKGVVLALVLLVAIATGAVYLTRQSTSQPSQTTPPANTEAPTSESNTDAAQAAAEPDDSETQAAAEPAPPPPPKDFCARDFQKVAERKADVADLQSQGGLVHIFEREAQLADAYGCADFYLEQGLDIDAVDPREDHDKLTGLFFAIQRNDPKMVRFMIDHGADLEKRAGKSNTKAMGYAYYLALQDQRINRNEVIGILDAELTRQANDDRSGTNASTSAQPASG